MKKFVINHAFRSLSSKSRHYSFENRNKVKIFKSANMKIIFKNKKIDLPVKEVGHWSKFSGLMFKSRNTPNLFFNFKKKFVGIHSFFVFFTFLALWLDKKNKVVEFGLVKPFTFLVTPQKHAHKLVEVPLNTKNAKIIGFFVGKKETFKYIRR